MKTTPQERMALGVGALLLALGGVARAVGNEPPPPEWTPGPEAPALAGAALRAEVEGQLAAGAAHRGALPPGVRLDPNTATAAELERLPGVGPALAERIVARREAVRRFRTLADLDSVAGVGPAMLERLAPHLTLPAAPAAPARTAARVTPAASRSSSPAGPLDINRATAAELESLPGVGPALARRIVEHREARGRFRSPDDLLAVPGIGPRSLERLRPAVRTSP